MLILIHLESTIGLNQGLMRQVKIFPLTPTGGSNWEPERGEQETSFGGLSGARARLNAGFVEDKVNGLYKILSEHFPKNDNFESIQGELYFKGRDEPLTRKGCLKMYKTLIRILGKNRIHNLGFDISEWSLSRKQAVALNKAQEELPSASDIDKAGDIELQEIVENASRSIENLNQQVQEEPTEDLPMQELLGLDKQLRSIRGVLKVEVAKKVEFQKYPREYDDTMREDITKQIDKLNDELVTRQESIDLLKGKLKNQIMSFHKTIAKVLAKYTSLAEKI